MATKPIRPTREVEHIPGIGGQIEFNWGNTETEQAVIESLYVRLWEIDREFVNARLAMSGGLGSIQYDRAADDFRFRALVAADLATIRDGEVGPGPSGSPFVDGRLEGVPDNDFKISMVFMCGDPTFVTDPGHDTIARPFRKFPPRAAIGGRPLNSGIYYSCKEVILDKVICVDASDGESTVDYIVWGHGSAPLRRNVGQTWAGSGAFGIVPNEGERK